MTYISHDKSWRTDFHNKDRDLFAKDRVRDINFNQLKLKVNDTYKKDEKIIMNFEPHNNESVVNKSYLDRKISRVEDHLSLID